MRARGYFSEMTGAKQGSIIGHNVTIEDLQAKFAKAGLQDEVQVKHFLDKLTYDRRGLVFIIIKTVNYFFLSSSLTN
jgi:hypothetical protein